MRRLPWHVINLKNRPNHRCFSHLTGLGPSLLKRRCNSCGGGIANDGRRKQLHPAGLFPPRRHRKCPAASRRRPIPIKRVVGDRVRVTADIFTDGHDILHAVLRYKSAAHPDWQEISMEPQPNDLWQGEFSVTTQGRHLYTLQAWTDRFQSWSRDLAKKFEAGQDISVDILVGVELIEATSARATGRDKAVLAAAPPRYAAYPRPTSPAPWRNHRARR